MCKQHIPILVYDNGGTQKYCEKCGKALSKWEHNGKPKKHPKKENKK
jgi:hypothetical protein